MLVDIMACTDIYRVTGARQTLLGCHKLLATFYNLIVINNHGRVSYPLISGDIFSHPDLRANPTNIDGHHGHTFRHTRLAYHGPVVPPTILSMKKHLAFIHTNIDTHQPNQTPPITHALNTHLKVYFTFPFNHLSFASREPGVGGCSYCYC